MSARESWRNVGRKIRYLRKAHRLTIKQLATGCGLSPNAISLLERGEVAPTVATLCKIASALGASPGSFFQEICPNEVVLTRAGDSLPDDTVNRALRALTGGTTDISEAVSAYSPEFVLCLNGCIEYQANGQAYQLEPGDSLSFNGNVLHCWRNRGSDTAIAVMVLRSQASLPQDPEE